MGRLDKEPLGPVPPQRTELRFWTASTSRGDATSAMWWFSARRGRGLEDVPYDVTFAFAFHAFKPDAPIVDR